MLYFRAEIKSNENNAFIALVLPHPGHRKPVIARKLHSGKSSAKANMYFFSSNNTAVKTGGVTVITSRFVLVLKTVHSFSFFDIIIPLIYIQSQHYKKWTCLYSRNVV